MNDRGASADSDETKALEEAYAALNRNDIPAFISIFDSQIERVEHFPSGGTSHGLTAMTEHVSKGRGLWAEGSCEPEWFIAAGDKIIAVVRVHVRLKDETEWRDARIWDVFTFRKGKVIQFHTLLDERQALEWAGSKALGPALV